MLLQLSDFIKRENIVSVQQLMREFHVDELALQPMLDLLVRKGLICEYLENDSCGQRCVRCKNDALKFYKISATLK